MGEKLIVILRQEHSYSPTRIWLFFAEIPIKFRSKPTAAKCTISSNEYKPILEKWMQQKEKSEQKEASMAVFSLDRIVDVKVLQDKFTLETNFDE